MIRATIKHGVFPDCPPDLPLFLDLDLEVLAVSSKHGSIDRALTKLQRPPKQYALYAFQIRQEYVHYSLEDYCKGRAGVLQRLQQGDIYFTEYWKIQLADLARENLKWEQGELAKGVLLTPDILPQS